MADAHMLKRESSGPFVAVGEQFSCHGYPVRAVRAPIMLLFVTALLPPLNGAPQSILKGCLPCPQNSGAVDWQLLFIKAT